MSLNQTPQASRLHVGIFGKRNAGKSSLINAITGQDLAIVSDVPGTTTDPVSKAMELLPAGPIVLVDTPGLDDEGALGALRVEKAKQVLARVHLGLLVTGPAAELSPEERSLVVAFEQRELPYLIVRNKSDLAAAAPPAEEGALAVSALTGAGIRALKEQMAAMLLAIGEPRHPIVRDLIEEGDVVVLVTPIDASAPKGRLILPQQQTIREILDRHAICVVTQVGELSKALARLIGVRLVITDSQAFEEVAALVPDDLPLTSFSILFARHKGILPYAAAGAEAVDRLTDGARVLISEGCTHHRQCDDIGTVKLPGWLRDYTGKNLAFDCIGGASFPEDLSPYGLVVHCGGCMLNDQEIKNRMRLAASQGVPVTNFGTLIAQMNGILKRSMEPLTKA